MTRPTLVPLESDETWLVGWRSRAITGELQAAVELWGGALKEGTDAGVPRVVITGVDQSLLNDVLEDAALGDLAPSLDPTLPLQLARALPRLTQVGQSLERSPLPAFDVASRWDTDSASWVPTASLSEPGAYRLRRATTRYGYRSRRDVIDGTIALTGVHLVKHLASSAASDPLTGYHAQLVRRGSPRRRPPRRLRTSACGVLRKAAHCSGAEPSAAVRRRAARRRRCTRRPVEELTSVAFPSPILVADDLRDAYLRYIDTAYWLRDSRLMAERRRLLDSDQSCCSAISFSNLCCPTTHAFARRCGEVAGPHRG